MRHASVCVVLLDVLHDSDPNDLLNLNCLSFVEGLRTSISHSFDLLLNY